MAMNCDSCGHKTNEIKTTSGVQKKGVRLCLHVRSVEDLSRDVLKSETCSVEIPELDLEGGMAALAGRFTTVEGLLVATKNQVLRNQKSAPRFLLKRDKI